MKHPRLQRRGAVYWFRCKIPVALIPHYGGKREILKSLRTTDPQEAIKALRQLSAQQDQEFERLRMQRATADAEVVGHEVTAADVPVICDLMVSHILQADEELRVAGLMNEELAEETRRRGEGFDQEVKAALARADRGMIEPIAEDFVPGVGYELPARDSELYGQLLYGLLKAIGKARGIVRTRNGGEVVETPPRPRPRHGGNWDTIEPPQGSSSDISQPSLQALLDYWKTQGDPKRPKTVHEAGTVIEALLSITGPTGPAKVTKQHVIALRDKLAEKGNAPATLKKKLGLLAAMFQVAFEDDQFGLTRNPCDGVAVRGSQGETKQRTAFTIEDLQRIFSSPVYTEGLRTEGMKGEAAYWLPLLALFTGARLNELGQLRVEDVKVSEGIHYLHITDLGEGQSLKKGSKNWRRVPLHEELIRLGFLRYVEDRRNEGRASLFDLKPDKHGHLTGNWSKRWNDYLDDVIGIDDKRKDFHSFRHGFKAFARLAGIQEDRHDALTGHANVTVARQYGSADGYPLAPLKEAIDALRFPGLDLQGIQPYANSRSTS